MRESFQISVISKMKFLGFPFNFQEKQKAAQLMEYALIRALSDEIVQRVIDIRQEKRLSYPMQLLPQRPCTTQQF